MIEVEHLTYRYPDSSDVALSDVSLSIEQGEIVGIVGPNGSGKSTLGRLIKGLLPPTSGRVRVDGLDTHTDSLAVRRLVGLVFQNPNNQIVNSIVEQEVAFGLENLGVPPSEIRLRVDRALRAAGLQGHETDECHSLSMANKQRVALAAVSAMEPRYLVLDEPTAWIEPRDRWHLLAEVAAWGKSEGIGLILVTHRMEEASLCTRLYGMLHGCLEVSGAPEDVLGDAHIRDLLALEIPETFALIRELREAGLNIDASAVGVPALADALWR
ncbi:MAG: energy-coupling factor transporter ATPase [Chloroflexota bacterium]